MRNAYWAEWIIARLTDRSRAASIIGDLLEAAGEERTVWFWWSVTGVVLSLVWRSLVGFAAALFCLSVLAHGWLSMHCPQGRVSWLVMSHCPSAPVHEPPPTIWMPIFAVLNLLGMAAPYAVVRYGFRDRFAQLTAALCAPVTAASFYWRLPAVVLPCIVLVLSIITFSGAFVHGRRALLALAAALAFGYGGIQLTPHLADWYLELASPSVTRTVVVQDSLPFLWVAMLTTACELMHRLLMQRDHQ
jgi:prepilin signal peptidase PulO-like enzyme (type II secretory pathway)